MGSLDNGQKALGCDTTKVVQVHVDRRQWGTCLGGDDLPIVKADYGDVLRDSAAALAQAIDHPAGDDVAATEDAIDAFPPLKQLPGGVIAPTFRPWTMQHARV